MNREIIGWCLIAILISSLTTFYITKNIVQNRTQKEIFQNMDNSYNQCRQICGIKKPALIDFSEGTMGCICLEVTNNGNSPNNNII